MASLYRALIRRYPMEDDEVAHARQCPCEGGVVALTKIGRHEDVWRWRGSTWTWLFSWSDESQEEACHKADHPEVFCRNYLGLLFEVLPY